MNTDHSTLHHTEHTVYIAPYTHTHTHQQPQLWNTVKLLQQEKTNIMGLKYLLQGLSLSWRSKRYFSILTSIELVFHVDQAVLSSEVKDVFLYIINQCRISVPCRSGCPYLGGQINLVVYAQHLRRSLIRGSITLPTTYIHTYLPTSTYSPSNQQ